MTTSDMFVGVDIGNTKLAVGLLDRQGVIQTSARRPTSVDSGASSVVETLLAMTGEVIGERGNRVAGVGIGFGGLVNIHNGIAVSSPNFPGWSNVPLTAIFSERFRVPTAMDNDANASALGERWVGAARGMDNFVYMTISTGIGGAFVLDGRLLRGQSGYAGEVGHMIVDPDGPPCRCGKQGCLEAMASGTALVQFAREAVEDGVPTRLGEMAHNETGRITGELLHRAALEGDGFARQVFARCGRYLGIGIANIISVLDPSLIILGGGVMKAGAFFLQAVEEFVARKALREGQLAPRIVPAGCGDLVGVVGAAAVALATVARSADASE